MGGLSKWIKIIRPNNLIIVAAAQFLFQHTIIMRIYAPRDIVLCGIHFYLFILCTLIIAGSGYIINDIFDRQEDAINKPEKFYLLNKNDIRKAYIYYVLLVISGACIAIYLGFKVNLLTLSLIHI